MKNHRHERALARPVTFRDYTFGKMTLHKGQSVRFNSFEYTDEGYKSVETIFASDGQYILCLVYTESQDCDGRLDTHIEAGCDRWDLKSFINRNGKRYPTWERLLHTQIDHTAERAGY